MAGSCMGLHGDSNLAQALLGEARPKKELDGLSSADGSIPVLISKSKKVGNQNSIELGLRRMS